MFPVIDAIFLLLESTYKKKITNSDRLQNTYIPELNCLFIEILVFNNHLMIHEALEILF